MVVQDPVTTTDGTPLEFISQEGLESASVGELTHLIEVAQKQLISTLSGPEIRHNFAEFANAESAQDWGTSFTVSQDGSTSNNTPATPLPPDNEIDSFPRVIKDLGAIRNRNAAIDALSARLVEDVVSVKDDWLPVLGIPEGVKGFKDGAEYLRIFLEHPRHRSKNSSPSRTVLY